MPDGMKAIGGVGNGVFEIVQDLVGYENLCIFSFEEPELYASLFEKVGQILYEIWQWFLKNYSDVYCVCRFGDDLGYKSNTLLSHEDIRKHIIPQYARIVDLVHQYGRPFLLHSCGKIFAVMEDLIDAGVDILNPIQPCSKDMNPVNLRDTYRNRIVFHGGLDTQEILPKCSPEQVAEEVRKLIDVFKSEGNYIFAAAHNIQTDVSAENIDAMFTAAKKYK